MTISHQYQLVLIKPLGFDFVEGFRNVIESLEAGLTELGATVSCLTNRIEPGATPILFGAHHLPAADAAKLPHDTIVYNLEQLAPGYPWYQQSYLDLLSRYQVWDYSAKNVQQLKASGIAPHSIHVPAGYANCLTRIPAATEDIDVLFYGIQNDRRTHILRALGEAGLNVAALTNVWGQARDAWIARAKVILNLHQSDTGSFEVIRVLYLLANRKAVVCETESPGEIDEDLRQGIVPASYDNLVSACASLVRHEGVRRAIAEIGFNVVRKHARRTATILQHYVPEFAPSNDFRACLAEVLYGRSKEYRSHEKKLLPDLPFERIAFYLPQFHQCLENDAFWGAGFTEWDNVARTLPRFAGHYQPRLPGELGYYDLAASHVLPRQVAMAKNYGLTGFMFFYYWLEGRPVLEKPILDFANNPDLDMKFFFMWANENWTRRWDGQDQEVLLQQRYSKEDAAAMMRHMVAYFRDPRYLKVGDRPVLVVYRANLIPVFEEYVSVWIDVCRDAGLGKPYLIMALSHGNTDPRPYRFDAALEYPPHPWHTAGTRMPQEVSSRLQAFDPQFRGSVFYYEAMVGEQVSAPERPFRTYRTAFPSWDNSARRRTVGSWIYTDSTPDAFAKWMRSLAEQEARQTDELRMVCVNAWNEWGEGAYLEPDSYFGYAYLDALHSALAASRPRGDKIMERGTDRDTIQATITIGLVEHIGDIIACEPVIPYLRKLFPEHPIIWVIRREFAELLAHHPDLTAVQSVDCLGDWIEICKTSGDGIHVNLHVHGWTCTETGMQVIKDSGAFPISGENYYHFGPILPAFCLGAELPALVDAPRLYIDRATTARVDALDLPSRYVILHGQSSEPARNWTQDKWRQLANAISGDFDLPLFEIGLESTIGLGSVSSRFCGRLSLLETAEVIRRATCFIGIDSGPAHMAVATKTLSVVIAGEFRSFKTYFPYTGAFAQSPGLRYVFNANGPAAEISTEEVYAAVRSQLQSGIDVPPQ